MKLLVDKADNVKVTVYCWESDGDIEASHLKSEVADTQGMKTVDFTFKKPSYADSNTIIKNAGLTMDGEDTRLDATAFQDQVLRSLLIDWSITDDEGEPVSVNTLSINNLVPSVARAAVTGVLDKIRI